MSTRSEEQFDELVCRLTRIEEKLGIAEDDDPTPERVKLQIRRRMGLPEIPLASKAVLGRSEELRRRAMSGTYTECVEALWSAAEKIDQLEQSLNRLANQLAAKQAVVDPDA